jgi:PAS domain S-box-containing protein
VAAIDALRAKGVRDFRDYFTQHPAFVAEAARLVRVRDVNAATLELFEARDKTEMLGSLDRVFLDETLAVFRDELIALAEGAPSFKATAPGQTLTGKRIDIFLSMAFPSDDPKLRSVLVSLLDVTERKRAEDAVRASQIQKSAVIEIALDGVIVIDERGRIVEFNSAAEKIFGLKRVDAIGKDMADLMPERFRDRHRSGMERYLATGRHEILGRRLEMTGLRADGSEFPVEVAINAINVNGRPMFTGFLRDVTAERQADAQLRQAQKMESVGQLTGGVAHDFNNLLTVIIGSLDLALGHVQGNVQQVLESALQAAERGAALVHRLLAFSRRQTLIPEALNFNHLAGEMEELLRRTLGEDIEIEMKLNPQLWTALADKGQLENALLNLTVNARDAMPAGGKLTIETGNVHLDEDYTRHNPEVSPGDYVMLAVTDTGGGMPEDVLERAFEPFFTTKEIGKGSGLGLSMIYGFTKQSGGHVKIYSEVGHGTTVRIYLPRQASAAASLTPAVAMVNDHPRGGEMVLVVEDNADVRAFVVRHLHELGYQVTEAKDGPSALKTLEEPTSIDLLLTDVIMPGGMTGRQLADEARRRKPELKTLFISGYTEDSIVHQGKLEPGVNFLSKPFRRRDLALKVREALDT